MKGGLDEGFCVYGAGVLAKHLQALIQEVAGVRSSTEDIEFVHRMRVSSRRLRSALSLFGECFPQKKSKDWLPEIKQVTKALGEARDLDVQMARLQAFLKNLPDRKYRAGVNRLLLRLKQRRQKLQKRVNKAMDHLMESKILNEMQDQIQPMADRQEQVYLFTPTLYQRSFNEINTHLKGLLSYDEIVPYEEKKEELHEMRVQAKWLRYAMENFAALYPEGLKPYLTIVRQVQETLGEIHDCDIWIDFLPDFMMKEEKRTIEYYGYRRPYQRLVEGIQLFEQERQETRSALYEEFVCSWEQWKQEDLWTRLHQSIQVPFNEK